MARIGYLFVEIVKMCLSRRVNSSGVAIGKSCRKTSNGRAVIFGAEGGNVRQVVRGVARRIARCLLTLCGVYR